jgi:VWFA-related protein
LRWPPGAVAFAQSPPQAPPVFRAEANLVEVIVRVTDAEGRFVPDLTQADFRLEEEGRAHPVMSAVATNTGADEARLFVLVLDNASSSPDTTLRVRQLARDFIERFVGPSDLVAAFPTRGWDLLTQEFTTDKTRALQTIDNYISNRCRGTENQEEKVYIARVVTDVLGAIAKHLAVLRGRRVSLVWISEGFDAPRSAR